MSAPTIELATGQRANDAQTPVARGAQLPASHGRSDSHLESAGGAPTTDRGHGPRDTHTGPASVGHNSPEGHRSPDAHSRAALGGTNSGQPAKPPAPSISVSLADPTLALAADILDDLESVRIANENRLRALTRDEADSDGEMRGFGLDESHPDVARLAALVEMLTKAEHQAVLNLNRALRRHPLGPWVKSQKGVGEKTAARLLAVIGDPYVNMQTGEVRTVSQLWAYCGHGDPARTLRKGMTQAELFTLGNPTAKKRVWLIATAILKAGGGEEKAITASGTTPQTPSLAAVYYHRKRATEGREHATECRRCGPSGKPAQPGSPWSDAHRHADALRIVGKEFLRALWLEAKRIHETPQREQQP